MTESEKHRRIAEYLAKKFNTSYNDGKGPDIIGNNITIEVETKETVADAKDQLRGYTGSCYVAGTDDKATKIALEQMKDTTIGVMDSKGNILKRSTRK